MSDVFLVLADGTLLIRHADEPSRIATRDEKEAFQNRLSACWGCPTR
jgi:hypothetical protein